MNNSTEKESQWKSILLIFIGILLVIAVVGAVGIVLGHNSSISLSFFFGPQEEATTSTSISIESSTENITIYVPVLLDENKTVLKMYENPQITGNMTTAVIDTEYGKALMISGSGLGNYLFNWNEVPGKDTDRFVRWLENKGHVQPGEKRDISKTDDGRKITVSGRGTWTFWLNNEGELEFRGVNYNVMSEMFGQGLIFTKEENGQLNIYAGNNEMWMEEKHGILKEDTQTSDEFLNRFTISMSNYTYRESFIQQPDHELRKIGVWVYSDSEVEKVRFSYSLDPENRINREILSIGTDTGVHLRKGWQVVNLSVNIESWD